MSNLTVVWSDSTVNTPPSWFRILHTFIHTYIHHTYIHTSFIHSYIHHTYIIHTFIDTSYIHTSYIHTYRNRNALFNDALKTFYLGLYGVGHNMVKDHLDCDKGNPLLPHGLLFPIRSKGSFICIIPQTG